MFVQSYLQHVKEMLKEDLNTLEKFLIMMARFNKSAESPVQVHV